MTLRASVVIGTLNRAGRLTTAVASVANQTLPPDEYEVIVVDNGSVDGTRDLVTDLACKYTNVRYEYEPDLGIASARNHGTRVASARIVAFMDDDARAEPGWLQSILEAFEAQPAQEICVGGKVLPAWEHRPPTWLSASLTGFLSLVDHGEISRPCHYPAESVVGCNVAFYRDFILGSGGFSTRLGRRGGSLLSNDDLDLLNKIHAAGGTVFYEANAIVHHSIPPERLTLRWFLRRVYAQGWSDAVTSAPAAQETRSRLLHRVRNALSSISELNSASAVTALLILAYGAGRLGYTLRKALPPARARPR